MVVFKAANSFPFHNSFEKNDKNLISIMTATKNCNRFEKCYFHYFHLSIPPSNELPLHYNGIRLSEQTTNDNLYMGRYFFHLSM